MMEKNLPPSRTSSTDALQPSGRNKKQKPSTCGVKNEGKRDHTGGRDVQKGFA